MGFAAGDERGRATDHGRLRIGNISRIIYGIINFEDPLKRLKNKRVKGVIKISLIIIIYGQ